MSINLIFIYFLCLPVLTKAQSYFFDPTFGTGGKVILNGSGSFKSLALQTDNKIVAGGGMADGKIVRFNHDGSIDSTFGIYGFYNTPVLPFSLTDIAIQSDGKIVGVGRNFPSSGNTDFVIFRVDTSGLTDVTFGVSGITFIDFAGYNDYAHSIAIQSDNKILLAGQFNSNQSGIVRLHPQGTIDSSFGTNGFTLCGYDDAFYMDVAPDGKIILGGTSSSAHNYTIVAMRFEADGSPDTTFNHTGVVYTSAGDFRTNYGTSVKVQPDSKIVVSGSGSFGSEIGNFVAVRYNTDGNLDNSFGSAGIANIDFGGANDFANAMALALDGKIIIAGSTGDDNNKKVAMACLKSDGTLNTAWGNFGRIVTTWQDTFDIPQDIALQTDNKMIVAGLSYSKFVGGYQSPAIARYTNLPSSVSNNYTPQSTFLYPNPAFEKLYLKENWNRKVLSCIAYNSIGQQIELFVSPNQCIETNCLVNGMYIFSLVFDDGSCSFQKIIIENKY